MWRELKDVGGFARKLCGLCEVAARGKAARKNASWIYRPLWLAHRRQALGPDSTGDRACASRAERALLANKTAFARYGRRRRHCSSALARTLAQGCWPDRGRLRPSRVSGCDVILKVVVSVFLLHGVLAMFRKAQVFPVRALAWQSARCPQMPPLPSSAAALFFAVTKDK